MSPADCRDLGIGKIVNRIRNRIENDRFRRIMDTEIPKSKMAYDFFDYVKFFDKADDTHLALALRTDQRAHLIDFLNQASPALTELFERHLVRDNGRNGVI